MESAKSNGPICGDAGLLGVWGVALVPTWHWRQRVTEKSPTGVEKEEALEHLINLV
jgi:hypothetical protein